MASAEKCSNFYSNFKTHRLKPLIYWLFEEGQSTIE
jgi:uncharacterized protein YbcV (DUF1398 family)